MTERLSVAVVGLGFGANHTRVLNELPNVRLAAVCDRDESRLQNIAGQRGCSAYTDYEEMLIKEHPDAVVIAVPASLHEAVAVASIEAGCAVLVEKPLAPNLETGRRLVEAARCKNVGLMPGHIERFNPALEELALRVARGDAGRVLQVAARRTGAIRVPPRDVNVVHDSAVHDIDAIRYVLGAEADQVYAQAESGVITDAEDSLNAMLRFETSDGRRITGTLEVSWLSPRRLRDLAVLCEGGLYVLDYAAQTLQLHRPPPVRSGPVQGWSLPAAQDDGIETIAIEPREQLMQELSAFVAALQNGSPMPVSAADGLAALAIADALTESARTGRPVAPARE